MMLKAHRHMAVVMIVLLAACCAGCAGDLQSSSFPVDTTSIETTSAREETTAAPAIDRESKIPAAAVKVQPETDEHPPKSYSADFYDPVPLPYPINTAGAEDSPFIVPSGETLYFWFTPDASVPAERQLFDGVTGIYAAERSGDLWKPPRRIVLQDPGKLALDGAPFVEGDEMWFCSAREGAAPSPYSGYLRWFKATFDDTTQAWRDWRLIEFPETWAVGELHVSGDELFFHSAKPGGKGGLDIWSMMRDTSGNWCEPQNISPVNTDRDDGWPAISPDGSELWISRDYSLWRSKKTDGGWAEPELMFSPLASEASIDENGHVFFVHHYFSGDQMIEADIYFAQRK